MNSFHLWYVAQSVNVLGTIAAIVGGGIAAWKAISEWKRATLQRADELKQREQELDQRRHEFRQKQAVFARDIIKDVFADKRAFDALTMLDFLEETYLDPKTNKSHHISRKDLRPALVEGIDDQDRDEDKDTFIRRAFEGLYDHLEQVQNLVDVGVLNLEDLSTAFRFYMQRALSEEVKHIEFLREFDYPKTEHFMKITAATGAKRRLPDRG